MRKNLCIEFASEQNAPNLHSLLSAFRDALSVKQLTKDSDMKPNEKRSSDWTAFASLLLAPAFGLSAHAAMPDRVN